MGKGVVALPQTSFTGFEEESSGLLIIQSEYIQFLEPYFSIFLKRDFDILEEPLGIEIFFILWISIIFDPFCCSFCR